MEKEIKSFTTSCKKGYLYCVKKADTGLVTSAGGVKTATMKPSIYDEIEYMQPYNPVDAAARINKKHNVKVKAEDIEEILTHARQSSPDLMFFKERPRPEGQKILESLYEQSQSEVSSLQAELAALKAESKAKSTSGKKKVNGLQQPKDKA